MDPGRKEIHRFAEEDPAYEYEYETSFVTLDLGSIDQNVLLSASSMHLVGLDSDTPYLQLSNTTMKGFYEDLIGSELFFRDADDPDVKARRSLKCLGSTSKRVNFRPVTLVPKWVSQGGPAGESSEPSPVLFQGPRKRRLGKDAPGNQRGTSLVPRPPKVRGGPKPRGRGRGRGRARGSKTGVERPSNGNNNNGDDQRDGHTRQTGSSDELEADPNDNLNWEDLDNEQKLSPAATPGPRRSTRPKKTRIIENTMDLDLLEGMEAMEVDRGDSGEEI